MSFTEEFRQALIDRGAALVGFGDITALPADPRENMPIGVGVAVRFTPDIIRGIVDHPTPEYLAHYHQLNNRLDDIVNFGASYLREKGYQAVAQNRAFVGDYDEITCRTKRIPHKTIMTRAGLGWIGKCALLITPEYGSMVRLSSILTDAPLQTADPIDASQCGDCNACQNICPANAVSGNNWNIALDREDFFNASACRSYARQTCLKHLSTDEELVCGRCIPACPHTQRALR